MRGCKRKNPYVALTSKGAVGSINVCLEDCNRAREFLRGDEAFANHQAFSRRWPGMALGKSITREGTGHLEQDVEREFWGPVQRDVNTAIGVTLQATGEKAQDGKAQVKGGINSSKRSDSKKAKPVGWARKLTKTTSEHRARYKRHWLSRLLLSVAAGLWLVIPMIVMSIDPSLHKSLIVASVAVLGFSIVASLSTYLEERDPVSVTAAYAAVMTVFVGTSLTNG